MICPTCGVEFKGGAFTRSRGPGTSRRMRECPNGHEFEEPKRVRVDKRDRIVSALRAQDMCDVCAGDGVPISGAPSICGGTGRGADEKAGLRKAVFDLRTQLDEARADAERWRWAVKHAAWLRHEHCAYVAIPVALDADLSCVAMRRAAVDAEIARTGGTKDD